MLMFACHLKNYQGTLSLYCSTLAAATLHLCRSKCFLAEISARQTNFWPRLKCQLESYKK